MTSNTQNDYRAGNPPIRDAACLILVDRTEAEPRVLMGRRLPSQVFLPNKWVFPGGRVDDDDRMLGAMMAEGSGLARTGRDGDAAFALTAIREMFEETGLFAGRATTAGLDDDVALLPPAWRAIWELGLAPDFEHFRPLARAITPPGRPRRFDTWFFMCEWQADRSAAGQPDGELLDIGWFTVTEARALDLPLITRFIVDDVAMALGGEPDPWHTQEPPQIAFYYQETGAYQRVLVPYHGAFGPP